MRKMLELGFFAQQNTKWQFYTKASGGNFTRQLKESEDLLTAIKFLLLSPTSKPPQSTIIHNN